MFGEEDWDSEFGGSTTVTKQSSFQSAGNQHSSFSPQSPGKSDTSKRTFIGRGRGKSNSGQFNNSQAPGGFGGGGGFKPRTDFSGGQSNGDQGGFGSGGFKSRNGGGSHGFSNGGQDGFGGDFKPRNNRNDDGLGGFGDSGSRDGGFKKRSFNDGGGFGSDKPRSNNCYKCGEEGHISRNCPSGGGDTRKKGCFKCGEEGHISRNCPTGDSGNRENGFGNRSSGFGRGGFKDQDEGGFGGGGFKKRDDGGFGGGGFKDRDEGGFGGGGFKKRDDGGFGGGGFKGRDEGGFGGGGFKKRDDGGFGGGGFKDRDEGGFGGGFKKRDDGGFGGGGFKDRDEGGFGGGGFKRRDGGGFNKDSNGFNGDNKPRSGNCFKCDQPGHLARDCPNSDSAGDRPRNGNCFKCDQPGHIARDCPNNDSGANDGVTREKYIPPPPPEDEDEMFDSLQRGINFSKYDSIPVEVSGENCPRHINTFEEAHLTETVAKNVQRAKYEKPTPVQKYSIPIIGAGRDLMACAQTGSGKTAAFLLPALTSMIKNGLQSSSFSEKQEPQTIIVGPTRELVNQIYLEARKFSRGSICRACVAYGGTSVGYQLSEIRKGCNILIATPGRLMDFINKGRIGLNHVQFLILDEADRMLDMGFEEEIRKLSSATGMPSKDVRQTLMFSATFPDEIQKLAHDFLKPDFIFLTVGRVGGACSDVTQNIIQVDQNEKREKLQELLADVSRTRSRTLVFVETKRSADFLACSLSQSGYPTTSIHGDRLQREREEALRDFKKGEYPILIATSVAARGLDIPKVEHVINYDLPKEIDEYVHRIGRTGRCGNLGRATSFFDNSKDSEIARCLIRVLADSLQEVPVWLEGCADGAIGTNMGTDRGGFGGRDARTKKGFGGAGRGRSNDKDFSSGPGRQTGDYDYNDSGGFGTTSSFGGNTGGGDGGFGGGDDFGESWD